MAITTVVINGKVVKPDGSAQVGGTIEITLNGQGTVDDGGTEQQVGGKVVATIGQDGSVNFNLIPSANYTGGSLTYSAKFILPNGDEFTKEWTIPGSGPVNIGDL